MIGLMSLLPTIHAGAIMGKSIHIFHFSRDRTLMRFHLGVG